MRNLTFVGVLLAVLAANLLAADEVTTSNLKLQVMTSESNKPVPNAHVIVRFVQEKFLKDKRSSWETKTNRKGFVVLHKVPHGCHTGPGHCAGLSNLRKRARDQQAERGINHPSESPAEPALRLLKTPASPKTATYSFFSRILSLHCAGHIGWGKVPLILRIYFSAPQLLLTHSTLAT